MSEVFLGSFTPTSISGCAMWLDGSDQSSASMTLSGTSLTLWKDKSGSGNNATPYNTSYATVNSNGVLFASQIYTTPYTSAPSTETAFVVFNVTAATYNNFQAIIGSSVNGGRQLALLNGSPLFGLLKAQIAWQNTGTFTPGATTLGEGFINGSTAYSGVNGTYTATTTVTWSSGGFIYLGTEVSVPNGNYVGLIKEILIYNVVLTTAQTQQVEGYLAWKWGIQGSLPSAHPYKSVSPINQPGFPTAIQSLVNVPVTPLSISGCILWMDAQDPSATGVQPSNGTSLTSWKDKSSSGFTLTSSGSAYNTTALNGFPGINIGTNFFGYDPGSGQNNWQEVFAVGIWTGGSTFTNFNGFITTSVDGDGGVSGGGIILVASGSGQTTFGGGPGQYTTTPWINGVQTWTALPAAQSTFVVRTAVASSVNLRGIRFGVDRSNGRPWVGFIGECICYNTALTLTQRQQIEGYLANKWGIKSSLPSTHPYYSIPPTTTTTLRIGQVYTSPTAVTFTYTGANQTYVVPGGAVSLTVYIWGAGGGSSISPAGGGNQIGGPGACLVGVLNVTAGESLTIVVGQGGCNHTVSTASRYGGGGAPGGGPDAGYSSSGGGRSAIRRGTADVVTAGGGGGGRQGSTIGGAGGITTGGAGTGTSGGGTQSAGGTGNNQGSLYTGAAGAQDNSAGAGGGYYGGGAGGQDQNGGGGSSLYSNLVSYTGYVSATGTAPNNTSPYYVSGVANGGTYAGGGTGGNGLVVLIPYIQAGPPAAVLPVTTVPNTAAITTITATGASTYTVPAGASGVYVYLWGGAGGYGNQPQGVGGSGGFVSGFFACAAGTVLSYVIGNSQAYGWTGGTPTILNGGGGSGSGGGYVLGGGFAGIFNCTTTAAITQANAIGIAGAGGAAGQYSYGFGGGGGYPMGLPPSSTNGGYAYGGTQSTAGSGSVGSGSGVAGGGGGGGGYYGGGSAAYGAGAGGSSYIAGFTSGAYYENGSNATATTQTILPGGYTNKYYTAPYGQSSSNTLYNGLIVIVPATSVSPTFQITATPNSQTTTVLSYTGDYQYYNVPPNVISLQAYLWGGGGPGAGGQPGGAGAFLTGTIAASGGETLKVIVGKGGILSTLFLSSMTDAQGAGGGGGFVGGQGGGRSAIQKAISGTYTEIITAGGGGSAGGNAGTYGGNAYYTGTSQSAGTTYGQGRIPTGGSATTGGLNTFTGLGVPYDGGLLTGGSASNAFNVSPITGQCGGGGGGGGYYGGGGGGRSGADTYGGGGGGSYYNSNYVTNFAGSNGAGSAPIALGYSFSGLNGIAGLSGASGSNGLVAFVATTGLAYPFPAATSGGTITMTGSYRFHTFTTTGSSTFTTNKAITAQVLVVGGGGGGGDNVGGGGGAGAAIYSSALSIPAGSYSLTVGAGGAPNTSGSASTFRTITAPGGGYGGTWRGGSGVSGGCGGGGAGDTGLGAAGTVGFAGGSSTGNISSGGGGGMGSAGSNAVSGQTVGGAGGLGATYVVGGVSYLVCGGGAGSSYRTTNPIVIAYGGSGIGGNGADSELGPNATAPAANTGSGGGGGGGGSSGAVGIIVIAFIP